MSTNTSKIETTMEQKSKIETSPRRVIVEKEKVEEVKASPKRVRAVQEKVEGVARNKSRTPIKVYDTAEQTRNRRGKGDRHTKTSPKADAGAVKNNNTLTSSNT